MKAFTEPEYAVFAGGECLDGRYATIEEAEAVAEDVRADCYGELEVDVDVSPEYMKLNMEANL